MLKDTLQQYVDTDQPSAIFYQQECLLSTGESGYCHIGYSSGAKAFYILCLEPSNTSYRWCYKFDLSYTWRHRTEYISDIEEWEYVDSFTIQFLGHGNNYGQILDIDDLDPRCKLLFEEIGGDYPDYPSDDDFDQSDNTIGEEDLAQGTYYIQNVATEKYIDIEGPSTSSGAIIHQWEYHGEDQEKWIVEYVSDSGDYWRLKSVFSNLYLGVDSSNTSVIRQYSEQNDYTLWKLERTSSGNVKFVCKATESSGKVLSVPLNSNSDGLDLTQLEYTNNTNYIDEWKLEFIPRKAIIIVPGIACSPLKNENGTKVWLFVGRQDQIACDENGNSVNEIYPHNPDNYGVLDTYKNIYNTLSSDYSDEYDVIFFAYDWRMSCEDAAAKLEDKTDDYDSCILIAHSMGGIVASSYLARSEENREKIDKLITVGTPYTGAPKSLYVFETGKLVDYDIVGNMLVDLVNNIPAVYELLPTHQYFNKYSSFINLDGIEKSNYSDSWNYIKTLDWAKKSDGTTKPMFDDAEAFHNSLYINGTHVVERSDVDTYKIIGIGEDTITSVVYDENNDYDSYNFGDGDGTVPTYSALNNVEKYSYKTYLFRDKDHVNLIKDEKCIQLIKDIIDEESHIYYTTSVTRGIDINTMSNLAELSNLGVETSDDYVQNDKRITIVTKNIKSLIIQNDEGYELYAVGEKLYYNDIEGVQHRAGSLWALGENSNQYVLFNNDYSISNINVVDLDSSIRIDFCNYGLSENAVNFNSITTNDIIQIQPNADQSDGEIWLATN